tara:strand:- start:1759 stop:1926 length:168 start_codon:yes stop_codon:yes gene_type:complete
MNFLEMVANLETAYYNKEVNLNDWEFDKAFDDWLDELSMSDLVMQLKVHGEARNG